MTITCSGSRGRWMALASLAVLVLAGVQPSIAETPEEAIRRIQAGRHTPMPPPTTAPASGPAGKGMTVENGTGHTLHVHFSGPVSRTVVVPDRKSESVELAVGDYEVAAEVPDSRIVPFYGRQAYQPFTHYWLKFYTQRAELPSPLPAVTPPAGQRIQPSPATSGSSPLKAETAKLSILVDGQEGTLEITQYHGVIKDTVRLGELVIESDSELHQVLSNAPSRYLPPKIDFTTSLVLFFPCWQAPQCARADVKAVIFKDGSWRDIKGNLLLAAGAESDGATPFVLIPLPRQAVRFARPSQIVKFSERLAAKDAATRRVAAETLGFLGSGDALRALTEVAKNDSDTAVRDAAQRAADKIRGRGPGSVPAPGITTAAPREPSVAGKAGTQQRFAIADPRFVDRSYSDADSVYFRTALQIREEGGQLRFTGSVADLGRGPMVWIPGSLHTWIGRAKIHGYVIDSSSDDPLVFWIDKDRGYVYSNGKGTVTMPDGTVVNLPIP